MDTSKFTQQSHFFNNPGHDNYRQFTKILLNLHCKSVAALCWIHSAPQLGRLLGRYAPSAARKDDFPCHAILSFLLTINIFQPASDCPKIRRPVNPKARRSRQLKGPTAAPPRRPGPKPRQPANPAARQSEGRPRRSGNPAIRKPGDPETRRSENRGADFRPGQHSKASRLQNYEFFPFAALSSSFYRPQFPRSSER